MPNMNRYHIRIFGTLRMDDAPLRSDQPRERARVYREMAATAVAPIVEAASSRLANRYEALALEHDVASE
jgi:hypothetical protein